MIEQIIFLQLSIHRIIQAAVLSMDESILDVDQVENLIKFCPTKEEMELLKVKDLVKYYLMILYSIFRS